jgi:phage gp36-like protein
MPYATQQDMIDRYGEDDLLIAADHDGDGVADAAVVTQGLSDATDVIDAHIGARYTLPLATVPAVLKRLCVDIALYLMSKPPSITEEKRKRYEDAIKLLQAISSGKVSLGISETGETVATTGGASFTAKDRVFTRRS